jgi:hypothetical protein
MKRPNLDIVDRAALWLGFVTTAFCVLYTARHIGTSLLAVAAWWGPIIGFFALVYAFMRLEGRCKRYERALREHNIDPNDLDETFT